MTPVVLVSCNTHRPDDGPALQVANEKYLEAVTRGCGAVPVLLPNVDVYSDDMRRLLARVDGLLLTGGATMVDPELYGRRDIRECTLNRARDRTVMDAIRVAIDIGVPILGICRGLQELNVAVGGSLCWVDEGEYIPHAAPSAPRWQDKYGSAHSVACTPDGRLFTLAAAAQIDPSRVLVNSLHRQGINVLGRGLRVEAIAPDGLIEAVSLPGTPSGFTVGVQWHAEWAGGGDADRLHASLFASFGEACRARARGVGSRNPFGGVANEEASCDR